jgi:MYXO-CTERM domain-containing protein
VSSTVNDFTGIGVPEPSSAALAGFLSLAMAGLYRRRR